MNILPPLVAVTALAFGFYVLCYMLTRFVASMLEVKVATAKRVPASR